MNYNNSQIFPQLPGRTLSINLHRRSSLVTIEKNHNSISSLKKIYSGTGKKLSPDLVRKTKSKRTIAANQGVRVNIRLARANRGQTSRVNLFDQVKPIDFSSKRTTKKILVLDLDETLVQVRADSDCDIIIPGIPLLFLSVRPFAVELLKYASENFDTYIFTASTKSYADRILNTLDPENKMIKGRLYREHCTKTSKGYVKDLSVFQLKDMKSIMIVDDQAISFENQPFNGIKIMAWNGDKADCELKKLIGFLQTVEKSDDVRVNIHALRMEF